MCVGGEGVMSAPGTEHATAGTDAPPTALPSLSLQAWCVLGVRSFVFMNWLWDSSLLSSTAPGDDYERIRVKSCSDGLPALKS